MMSSLFSAVSGMKNHQTRMDVIGNNIANVNTYGFKAGRVTFQDQLSQTLQGASMPQNNRGGTNPMQKGLGVGIASIDTLFTDGSYQSTGKATDLSIQGDGFFILSDGATQYYTRAGNFDFDTAGNYVVPGTGLKVMGWTADAAGAIDLAAPPGPLQVPVGKTTPAQISTNIVHAKNLSADSKPGTTNSASIDIYDSQGIAHKAKTTYSKLSDNTWLSYTAVSDIMTDAANKATGTMQLVTFNSDGTLKSTQTVLEPGINGIVNVDLPFEATLGTEVYGSAVAMVNGIPTTIGIKMKKTVMENAGDATATPPVAATSAKWQVDYTVNGKAAAGGEISEGDNLPAVTISGTPVTTVNLIANTTIVNKDAVGKITPNLTAAVDGAMDISLPPNSPAQAGNVVNGKTVVTIDGVQKEMTVKATSTANPNEWNIEYFMNGNPVALTSGGTSATVVAGGTMPIPALTNADGTPVTFVGGTLNEDLASLGDLVDINSNSTESVKFNIPSNPANGSAISIQVLQGTPPTPQTVTATCTRTENATFNLPALPVANGTTATTTVYMGDPLVARTVTATYDAVTNNRWDIDYNGTPIGHIDKATGVFTVTAPQAGLNINNATMVATGTTPTGQTASNISWVVNGAGVVGATINPTTGVITGWTGNDIVATASIVNTATGSATQTVKANLTLPSKAQNGDTLNTSMNVLDKNGVLHAVDVKAVYQNGWQVTYSGTGISGSGKVVNGGKPPAVIIGTETINLGGKAIIDGSKTTGSIQPDVATGTAANVIDLQALTFTPLGGVSPMSVTIDLSTVTQFGGDTSLQATDQDGNAAGSLNGVAIDTNGLVIGKFTNGKSEILGQVALANFNNPAGLEKAGTSLYARSNNSGEAQIGGAGIGGLGMLNASNLEMSNVDLSEEFSNMIITQRGFQSNARVITTSDEMLQELTNLKR